MDDRIDRLMCGCQYRHDALDFSFSGVRLGTVLVPCQMHGKEVKQVEVEVKVKEGLEWMQ